MKWTALATRRRWLLALAAQAAAAPLCGALADAAPLEAAQPLRLWVPFPAGGVSDALARAVQPALAQQRQGPVVVHNVAGAGGAIAVGQLLAAPANGLSVLQGSPAETIVWPAYSRTARYASEDLQLLHMLGSSPLAIYARPGLPAAHADAWLALAQRRAAQGQPLTYATTGTGSLYHLWGAHTAQQHAAPMLHVPYRGGAPALHDVLANRVDVLISVWGQHYRRMVDSGQLRLLALLTPQRLPQLAAYPCAGDSDALAGQSWHAFSGYFVRADTPAHTAAALHRSLQAALAQPRVQAALQAHAMQAAPPAPLAHWAQHYAHQTQRYRALVQDVGDAARA